MRTSFIDLLCEICKENEVDMRCFSHNWIVQFSKDQRFTTLYGYNFDINGSAAQQICCDKNATWLCLRASGIPCIEHQVFMNPADPLVFNYVPESGSISAILKFASQYDYDIVVKPLKGTGGVNVERAKSPREIEAAVYKAWSRDYGVAVSPFIEIKEEIRAIVLLGSVRLMYRKQRLSVLGDGIRCLEDLIKESMVHHSRSTRQYAKALSMLSLTELARVLTEGEEYPMEWRHNLGLGAKPEPYSHTEAEKLALDAVKALNMKFCSVDLVILKDGSLAVLEVNSGVMMDSFLTANSENRAVAKQIYIDVINYSLEMCMQSSEFIT